MNIYNVFGIRHQAVVFAETPEEAVSQAMDSGEVGNWEYPEAQKIPLPEGYALRPAQQSVQWLRTAMEETWTFLHDQLKGLTDEEFFWEPVPHCWTVHPDEAGRWIVDYEVSPPDPPPFTTIGWRVAHVAACKVMYYEYAFGPGKLTWDALEIPCTATNAVAWLEEGHAQLKTGLDASSNGDLVALRLTNWGEQWPTWRIFWAMISHDLHHGAEIGCLRDLYRLLHPETS